MRKLFLLIFFCTTAFAARHPGTDAFLARAAAKYGLAKDRVAVLLDQAEFKQSIVDAISRPAEAKPWYQYRPIFLSEKRIEQGVEFWRQNRDLVKRAAATFGVDAAIIVAIIGVETSYGSNTGRYRVIDALVTLGLYYPRNLGADRSRYFSDQLMQYIKLTDEEGLPAAAVTGSYAGAMGMGQFMPGSYREYAVDFDKDGKRDLWRSKADVVGSVANYLHVHGWKLGQPVARRAVARSDAAFDKVTVSDLKPTLTVAKWQALGFRSAPGLAPDLPAAVLKLSERERETYWLTFHNFYVITRYNRSPLYAMAVLQLSREIGKRVAED